MSYDVTGTKIPTANNALRPSLVTLNPELTTLEESFQPELANKTMNVQFRLSLSSKVRRSLKRISVAKAKRKLVSWGPPIQERVERRE